jgi:Asp-tRNA(Asn)/Glu-tRNA(Gln) amidotransferase A subunit family amidase
MPAATDPTRLTATEAAAAVRAGELTSVAIVSACLDLIAADDARIRAWEHIDREKALSAAREADKRIAAGKPLGPLEGVPVGIKDIIDTADMPTENGCPFYKGRQPDADADCVAALRKAGAIILGKTVTTELALLNPSRTLNPHDTGRSPGGSSAGSAAAVSAFMVPAALGTQTAGSVIRPASYCGIVGFKPTVGLIPLGGVLPQSHTLDTLGVLARSLEDAALLTDCMTGSGLSAQLALPLAQRPRFAFIKTPAWQPEGEQPMQAAMTAFAARMGECVEDVVIPALEDAVADQRLVHLAENASYYGPLLSEAADHLSPLMTERLKAGFGIAAVPYIDAMRRREPTYRAITAVLDRYDAILTPAAPGAAPKLDRGITGNPIFSGMWTWAGVPCVTLPLLQAEGVPLGVQLVCKRGEDARLLQTARWLAANAAD